MPQKVKVTITGSGAYSHEVMNSIAGQLQKYLLEQETIEPSNVLVVFSNEYLAQVVFIPTKGEILEHTEPLRQVLVTLNVPVYTLRTKKEFKLFLDKLFGHYGIVVLADPFDVVQF